MEGPEASVPSGEGLARGWSRTAQYLERLTAKKQEYAQEIRQRLMSHRVVLPAIDPASAPASPLTAVQRVTYMSPQPRPVSSRVASRQGSRSLDLIRQPTEALEPDEPAADMSSLLDPSLRGVAIDHLLQNVLTRTQSVRQRTKKLYATDQDAEEGGDVDLLEASTTDFLVAGACSGTLDTGGAAADKDSAAAPATAWRPTAFGTAARRASTFGGEFGLPAGSEVEAGEPSSPMSRGRHHSLHTLPSRTKTPSRSVLGPGAAMHSPATQQHPQNPLAQQHSEFEQHARKGSQSGAPASSRAGDAGRRRDRTACSGSSPTKTQSAARKAPGMPSGGSGGTSPMCGRKLSSSLLHRSPTGALTPTKPAKSLEPRQQHSCNELHLNLALAPDSPAAAALGSGAGSPLSSRMAAPPLDHRPPGPATALGAGAPAAAPPRAAGGSVVAQQATAASHVPLAVPAMVPATPAKSNVMLPALRVTTPPSSPSMALGRPQQLQLQLSPSVPASLLAR